MNWIASLSIVLVLVAAATALGLVWRSRAGRVTRGGTGEYLVTVRAADVADVATESDTHPPAFGTGATLLQFSTEFCSPCRATRTQLAAIAAERDDVAHLDIDLTNRADLARRFSVLQTPTTLVLDGAGVVRARIGGAPRLPQLRAMLEAILHGEAADDTTAATAGATTGATEADTPTTIASRGSNVHIFG